VSNLVTGEAVVLDLQLAKLPSRAVGFLLDALIQIALFVGLTALVGGLSGVGDTAMLAAISVAGVILIFIGLPTAVETLSRGRSLGKMAMGLRAVRDDGGPVTFRHALVRALGGFVADFWILGWVGVGVFTSLASSRGKRVGDYLAGTVVVRERIPVHGGPVAQMPPQLAYWAAGLELSGLPDDLALAVRQYLSRLGDLAPDVRDNLGRRLAAEVAERIGQPVPDGAPPWVFLSAVLSERRNRELARLTNSPAHPAVTRNGSEPPPRPPDSDGPFAAPR
jgi:uncharacterized RDD family membrane protein YckC